MSKAAAEVKQDNRLVRYFKETRAELRKVHWPTRKEARNLTLIVLSVTVAMAAGLGLLDLLLSWLTNGVYVNPVDPIRIILVLVLVVAGAAALIVLSRQEE